MLAIILLLILGFNGAVYLLIGETLAGMGYGGFLAAFLHAFGSALSLSIACYLSGTRLRWDRESVIYYAVGAFLGLIGPAVTTIWIIPFVGTGMMAVAIATSPLFTILISHLFRVEVFSFQLFFGIVIGFLGASLIIMAEISWPTSDNRYIWLIASLVVPLLLASGNVARTALWPKDTTPFQAGAGISLLAMVASIPIVLLVEPTLLTILPTPPAFWMIVAFVVLNCINAFPFFFLQRIGGPTILSLLSHVMAAFGLLLGALWLGESYRWVDLLGAGLILTGVSATSILRYRQQSKARTNDLNHLPKNNMNRRKPLCKV